MLAVEPYNVLNFFRRTFGVCGSEIDFVYDGNDFKVVVEREIAVCKGLRLYALRRVDYQNRAFARGK